MDGDDLESEPSEPPTLSEMFMTMFPYYHRMGMSFEEYWNGPPWLAKVYREEYQQRQREAEWARWRQGLYVFNAIMCAAPVIKPFVKDAKPGKYPEEPFPITEKEAREQQERQEEEAYKKALEDRRAASKREKKRRADVAAMEQEVNGNGDD